MLLRAHFAWSEIYLKRAIVVGSGAGGATVAKELQGAFEVTVLEAGREFRPFTADLSLIGKFRKSGLLFDERMIRFLFPAMKVRKSSGELIIVNGSGAGGTTTICTANGIRRDQCLKEIGINLDKEFEELEREVPLSDDHRRHWNAGTKRVFEICREMGLDPVPSPKLAYRNRCAACGRCIFGCRRGAKWDSREFLNVAMERGAKLLSGCRVKRVFADGGEVYGVEVAGSVRFGFLPADLVVLAAGGLGTPVILRESGFECEDRLFVDPMLCVATKWEGVGQDQEIPMPFIVQREHFMVSPYFDYLSFFFNRQWKYSSPDIYSMMVKLADTGSGSVTGKKITKGLNEIDRSRMNEGVSLCMEIFRRLGREEGDMFLGTINAGHPGGMLPLTGKEATTFHHDSLPQNLYVADATLFPESLGNPPILTIMAMAKRIGRICAALA